MNQLLSIFFEEALEDFIIVPMEESVLQFSFDLVLEDDLRTVDSLQLSAALSLKTDDNNVQFVSADAELVNTAETQGVDALNPAEQ